MKADIMEIQPGDVVMTTLDIGNIAPNEVDKFVNKHMKPLKDTFGCQVAVLPIRGEGWDFTIIRNPNRTKEKSYANTSRKRALSRRDR